MKIFLGGTCNNTTWRDSLIPILDEMGINYFNPIVDDWTSEAQEVEIIQKDSECNIHLYYITAAMTGVFSIAESVDSAHTSGKQCILIVNPEGFDKG